MPTRRVRVGAGYVADPGGGPDQWQVTYEDQEFTGAYVADPGGGPAQWQYAGGQNPADWPDLKLWLQFTEGSGSVLRDKSQYGLDLSITSVGGHNPWATPGMFSSGDTFGSGVYSYARAARGLIDHLVPNGRAWAIELWGTPGNYADGQSGHPVSVGSSTIERGYSFRWRRTDSTSMYITANARGVSGSGAVSILPQQQPPAEHHWVLYSHGSDSTTPLLTGGARDGVPVTTANLSASPGSIDFQAAGGNNRLDLTIGALSWDNLTGFDAPFLFRMVRVWLFDAIPTNINDVMTEMWNNGNPNSALPDLLRYPPDGDNIVGVEFS